MPTSYSQLLQPLIADPDPRGMIRFLQDRGVLASAMTCDKCHVPMNLTTRNRNSDRCAFKCPKDKCRCIKSVRHGSWFTHMRVPIQKVVWIVYLWSIHMPVGMAAQLTAVSQKSIIQIYQFLRDVCSAKLVALNGEKLGGPGVIVEIDESLFRHKPKYHRGRAPQNELWVFGMVDTSYTPCRGYMEIVERRDAATLIPIIEQHVAPGSIIHSDQWRAYAQLQNDPRFTYRSVNHSENFVDPVTGVHTQTIESYWGRKKRHLKNMNGTRAAMMPSYLDQFMWEDRFGKENMFDNVLQHIAEQYRV